MTAESRRLLTGTVAAITPPPDFRKGTHEALKSLRKESPAASPLQAMRLFRVAQRSQHNTPQMVTQQVLQLGLQALTEKFEAEAKILRAHFVEGKTIQTIATEMSTTSRPRESPAWPICSIRWKSGSATTTAGRWRRACSPLPTPR